MLLKISELIIDFDTRYPDYVRRRCERYLVDSGTPVMSLRPCDEYVRLANRDNVGLMEAELYAMTIPFSEQLPMLGRLMTHGVAIECDGKAFIFTAGSGVGKSTHAFLWQKYLGDEHDVRVINGDKPILWFKDEGIMACGSPWSGKEHLDRNVCVPLKGVCLLQRLEASDNAVPNIRRASREETLDFLMHQVFIPNDAIRQVKTLQMLGQLYDQVPVFYLAVDMSREAVMASSGELLKN